MKTTKSKARSALSLALTFALCFSMTAPALAAAELEPEQTQTNSQPAEEQEQTSVDSQPSEELDSQPPEELNSQPSGELNPTPDESLQAVNLDGLYRVYLNLEKTDHGRNLIGPSQDNVSAGTQLYCWHQDNAQFTTRMYHFVDSGDGTYYWQCRNDENLVVQAASNKKDAILNLAVKNENEPLQKWSIEQTDSKTYTLKMGSLYLTGIEHGAPVLAETQGITFDLEKVTPQISLALSNNRVALDAEDQTVTATVSGTDANFNEITDVSSASFTSSDEAVASVSSGDNGTIITALSAGTTTITAKLTVDGQECTATAELEVVETIEAPTLDGIYFITGTGAAKDQCIEPGGDSIKDGNNVWFWSHGVQSSRVWVFNDAGSGYVYWQPMTNTSLYMIDNGINIDFTSSVNEKTKWEIIPTGTENQYKLRNAGTKAYVKEVASSKDGILTADAADAAVLNFAEQPNTISFTTTVAFLGQEIKNAASALNPNSAVTLTSSDPAVVAIDGTTIKAVAKGSATITAQIGNDESTKVTQTFTVLDTPEGWEGQFRIDGGDGIGGIFEPSGNSGTGNIYVDNELYVWNNGLANYRTYRFSDAGNGYVRWHFDYNPGIVIADAGENRVLQKAVDVNDDSQLWKLTPVADKNGVYTIQSKAGSYIATAGDTGNAKIVLSSDASLKSVNWKITSIKPSLILTIPSRIIAPGGTAKADLNVRDSFGSAIIPNVTVTSSDPNIIKVADASAATPNYAGSVTFTGQKVPQILISGVAEGKAKITASTTIDGLEYTTEAEITVTADAPLFSGDEWYKGITIPEVNREPSHADFFPYQDAATAAAAEKSALDSVDEKSSSYYQLLSQKDWDFAMVKNPAEAEKADEAGWLEATLPAGQESQFHSEFVPAEWQAYKNDDGTFKYDEPVYTNSYYPWASISGNGSPNYADPQAPVNYNPVGYYRTTFQTPTDWNGRNVFISFQGVKAAYYVYVNGKAVGYSTDSFTAHDFNITPYLNSAGQSNTLAVKVFRFSIGSYLENQDMIHGSGIIRDVFLYSKDANAEIRDFFVQTKFTDRSDVNSDVTVSVDVDVRNLTNTAITDEYTVDLTLKTLDGTVVSPTTTLSYHNLTPLQGVTGASDSTKKAYESEKKVNLGDRQTATIQVTNPDKWFPDTPNLYMLTLELKDSSGKVIEATAQRIGFREIYKININDEGQEQMQITGQKLIFRGVNRHDTDPINGHAVSVQNVINDLKLMKQYNVNAVRTSHYPNNRILYALADELGLYIYAEANVESHMGGYDNAGSNSAIPGSDARWVWPVMDRNMNMVELLKNHASIIGWSYSNESTYTSIEWNNDYCFWATAQAVLNRDPSRLRMYERENHNYYHTYNKPNDSDDPWSYDVRKLNIIDVHATQYPEASQVNNWVSNTNNKLPYFQQEYEHAMGQSFGSFNEFWKLNRTKPNAQGGFIWDWMDQSRITTRIVDGKTKTFFAYGGDWIDTVTNADAFCANGVIYADRTPSSRAIQMRYDHQQVNFYPVDDSGKDKTDYTVTDKTLKFKVVNEYENTDLSAFNITWKLMADTEELGRGTLNLSTASMTRTPAVSDFSVDFSSDIVTITLPDVTPRAGVNYLLNFSVENKTKPDWDVKPSAPYATTIYNNVVAYDQFDLTPTGENAVVRTALDLDAMKEFSAVNDENSTLTVSGVTAEGNTFSFVMDKTTGIISNYELNSKVVLEKGPVPSFWRAMTYNDSCTNYIPELRNESDTMTLQDDPVIVKDTDNKHIKVTLNVKLAVDATQTMTYDIYSNGEIVVSSSFTPNSDFANGSANWRGTSIPKIGIRMTVAPGYENLEYLGRGPDETYIDRKTASLVDLYKSTVTEQFVTQYLKPQENGNRTDVRWTSLTNDQGEGLMVVADGTVETSALHVKAENINQSTQKVPYDDPTYRHSTDVPMDVQTYWCIDAIQRGVSNTAFFGHAPLPGFYPTTTGTPTYSETFRIVPVGSSTDKMATARLGFTAANREKVEIDTTNTANGEVETDLTAAVVGQIVTVTARPNQGYFAKVVVHMADGSTFEATPGEDNTFTFVMPEGAVTVEATFSEIPFYQITIASAENGTVAVNPSTAQAGETITVTTTPDAGYQLDSITVTKTGDSNVTVLVSDNTFVMPEYDVTVTAKFSAIVTPPQSYAITTVTPNNGTVTVNKSTAQAGETITVTATPNTGYQLDSITVTRADNGTNVTVNANNTFVMPASNVTVTAKFSATVTPPQSYAITTVTPNYGTVTVNKSTAQAGETITVTATPNTGYQLDSITVTRVDNGTNITVNANNTFVMPASNVTVTAKFSAIVTPPQYYAVNVASTANGTVRVDRTSARPGETITITVTPANGYVLSTLTVSKTGDLSVIVPVTNNTFFTMPDYDVTVEATFTVSSSNNGPSIISAPTTVARPSHTGTESPAASPESSAAPSTTPESTSKKWNNPFSDVDEGKWYYDAVRFVETNGLMGGYGDGQFGPEHQLTRAQLAQILYNKEKKPAVKGTSNFTDVADNAWYTDAIVWAADKGIVNGYGNGQFGPNDNITREQLAIMLWRYSGSPKVTGPTPDFTDAEQISSYAMDAVCWAVKEGVINGYDNGQMDPQGLATRAQVAQMFKNLLDK